jgi:hypothetical protein
MITSGLILILIPFIIIVEVNQILASDRQRHQFSQRTGLVKGGTKSLSRCLIDITLNRHPLPTE